MIKVNATSNFTLLLWLFFYIFSCFIMFFNLDSFATVLFFIVLNLAFIYFGRNSLKVYFLGENEIELRYRWIDIKLGKLYYSDIKKVHYHVATGRSSTNRIEIQENQKLGFVLPFIEVESTTKAMKILDHFKRKKVKVSTN